MNEPLRLTVTQRKALAILRDRGPLRPREFAKAMWPESPGWQRVANCGPNGAHRGGCMYQAGGSFLARLARLGLTSRAYRTHYDTAHEITRLGRETLAYVERA